MYPSPASTHNFTVSSVEVRRQLRIFGQIGTYETSPELKRLVRSHALALAQVAEAIERREMRSRNRSAGRAKRSRDRPGRVR